MDLVHELNSSFRDLYDLERLPLVIESTRRLLQDATEESEGLSSSHPEAVEAISTAACHNEILLDSHADTREELLSTLTNQLGAASYRSSLDFLSNCDTKLRKLEYARDYFLLLKRLEDLRAQTLQSIEKSPLEAVGSYNDVNVLLESLSSLGADDHEGLVSQRPAGDNLRQYAEQISGELYNALLNHLGGKLRGIFKRLNWPNPVDLNQSETIKSFSNVFGNILRLVKWSPKSYKPAPLDAFSLLLELHVARFKYHFQGKRPTNRLDKPEWCFTDFLKVVREQTPFLSSVVQQVLDASVYKGFDAKVLFIHSFLVAVNDKLRHDAPLLLSDPPLMSHTIAETTAFDTTLREVHLYAPPGSALWGGCVSTFLENTNWFKAWLAIERSAAFALFDEAMARSDRWDLAYEAVLDELHRTKSAEILVGILEGVTERYRRLPRPHYQLQFFAEIQMPLLEKYLHHVQTGVDQHQAYFAPLHGTNSVDENIQRQALLARYAGSLGYLCEILGEWSEQILFISLWDIVFNQAQASDDPSSLNSSDSVFTELVDAYQSKIRQIADILEQEVMQIYNESTWRYYKRRNWCLSEPASDPTVSSELVEGLSILAQVFTSLSGQLPASTFQPLLRNIVAQVDSSFFQNIVLKGTFNQLGGQQIQTDLSAGYWNALFRVWIKHPESLLKKSRDSSVLLSLSSKDSAEVVPDNQKPPEMVTLAQLVDLFVEGDTSGIESSLDRIGVTSLAIKEVKSVLGRRIEVQQ
ncbi:TIP-1 family-domain-containing protein [Polychytrium aggregatum]|uniref:TIP-1 family-domain-containing protein n=1 Tax=Polychytrium aggregatum TaxID=110093 RepID=UPI0022FE08F0|nr:TIP-1 family-domain-containing protein [Polychytrium aggregatum]KAI9209030.1 TIP-1 family-domain-containing protein [Polychytrium aggregatum]